MAELYTQAQKDELQQAGDGRTFVQVRQPAANGGSVNYWKPALPVVDLDGALQSQNRKLVGFDNAGQPLIQNPDTGQVGPLDVDALLAQKNLTRDTADIVYNTPKNPIQDSPVSPIDRVTYATIGSTKGFVAKLKNDFDAVQVDQNNGIVVKKGPAWYAVDPSITANHSPKELATDLLEVLPAGMVAAATTGAAIALAPAAAATAVGAGAAAVLGGVAAGTLRTSLGRFVGTYQASPEEQIFDIGMEGLANLGGHLIAPGGDVTKGIFASAARKVAAAGGAAKEAVASFLGMTSGAGRELSEFAIDNMPRVLTRIEGYAARGGGSSAIQTQAKSAAEDTAREWLDQAQDDLQGQFKDGMNRLFQEAGNKKMSISMSDVVQGAEDALESTGLGKFVEDENGTRRFMPLTEQEKVFTGSIDPAPETFDAVKRLADSIARFRQVDQLEGPDGARRLVNLNKALNRAVRSAANGPEDLQAAVGLAASGYKQSLGQAFANAGLGKEYVAMNAPYIQYSDIVDTANRLLQQDNGVSSFVKDVVRPNQAQNFKADFTRGLLSLTGDKGQAFLDKIQLNQAAFHFAPIAPKMGVATFLYGAGGASLARGSPLGALGAVGAVAATSPRIGLTAVGSAAKVVGVPAEMAQKVLPYAYQLSDALKAIPAMNATKQVLSNPQVIGEMLRQTIMAPQHEEMTRRLLLQQVH